MVAMPSDDVVEHVGQFHREASVAVASMPMFESLSERLDSAFQRLRRKGKLTEADLDEGLREIRLALLEADVAAAGRADVPAARARGGRRRGRSSGRSRPASRSSRSSTTSSSGCSGQEHRPLRIAEQPPTVILLVGLQGSGKTTAAAKLALQLKGRGLRPLLAACDLQRPAAVDQLVAARRPDRRRRRGGGARRRPCRRRAARARSREDEGYSALIVDSAGRLHVDEELMDQAARIRDAVAADGDAARPRRDDRTGRAQRRRSRSTSRSQPTGVDPHQARRRRARRCRAVARRDDRRPDPVRRCRREARGPRAVPSRPHGVAGSSAWATC